MGIPWERQRENSGEATVGHTNREGMGGGYIIQRHMVGAGTRIKVYLPARTSAFPGSLWS